MATVRLSLPPASLVPARNKVTITGYNGTVRLDITRPEVDIDGLADDWQETERVIGYPILQRAGKRLRTFTMSALLTKERTQNPSGEPAHVHTELLVLAGMASPATGDLVVAVAYDALLPQLARYGGWVITDYRIRSIRRRPSDHGIVRAEVDLTFTEASRPPGVAAPLSPTAPARAATAPPPSATPVTSAPAPAANRERRHTVVAGDTLSAIAVRYYGNAAVWPFIANANGIRDPRRLAVGTVLTVN